MVEREEKWELRFCVGFSEWVLIGGTSGNALSTASGEEGSIVADIYFRRFEFAVGRGSAGIGPLGNLIEEGGPGRTLILFTRWRAPRRIATGEIKGEV
jgi:hypothetical protein